ncbi:MAG: Eco57I restriction-modification methylase domain-containing protein [Verrucomicrobiia bacterium]
MNTILQQIEAQLTGGNLAENLGELFCQTLNWGAPRGMTSRTLEVGTPVSGLLTLHPVAQLSGLPVYRIDWPEKKFPGVTARRVVQRALKPLHAEHLLCYVTSDQRQAAFTWARQRPDEKIELRTLPYEVGSPARTTIERLGELAFSLDELEQGEPLITTLTDKLNRAFDVEAVTKRFFDDYKKVFANLQAHLTNASRDKIWAHDYALQLLNRLMFLYFIQRKRWLVNNPNFIAEFWRAYKNSDQPKDTFFDRWLSVLFFEAFNNKFHGGHRHFPDPIRHALAQAPFLNGGLFTQNKLDDAYDAKLPDEFFTTLFDSFDGSSPGFLERYNFTIAESTPLDIEVAVDPEMIGKVYESLVNITFEGLTEDDLRGSAGIFYTPRVEIDLMCRLSLTDTLANRLGQDKKPLLYDAVFAYDPANKEAADRALAAQNLWPDLNRLLRETTVCDPACGSGSFLVGMLLVLDDLQARANAQLGLEETPYERRRRIIGEQLYGVDVMDWAIHVTELRLWLQLVVETELQAAELKFRPLLPNLSFKVRCGDSLVQEIGGINLGLHRDHLDIPASLKGRLTQLKGKKLRFYQGESGLREADLKKEELDIFHDILTHKRLALQKSIAALTHQIESRVEQGELAGIAPGQAKQERLRLEEGWRAERAERQAELNRIEQALQALRTTQQVPFVWDIAFVEIFEGDKAGFDIVIGNPPYVRKEKIAPPDKNPEDYGGEDAPRWKEQKADYKAKLAQSVAAAWPKFFRYKPSSANYRKLDGQSDLYIYFYLHGLALLTERGSFCFITSNSWLDVGYGADLQEFLLKHSHVKFILDNERKRSFAQADVNTIIALLAPPDDRRESGLDQTARFVMFKVPFEDVLDAATFKRLESAAERQSTDRWRICVRPQRDLFEEGLAREEDDDEPASAGKKPRTPFIKTARYEANKWGGKYLRAPDILMTHVLPKLKPLRLFARIEGYIHGNNIGPRFPSVPFVDSIDSLSTMRLTENSPGVVFFGVKSTGNSRQLGDLLYPRMVGARFFVPIVLGRVYGQKFYKIIFHTKEHKAVIGAFCNSTVAAGLNELIGNVPWGLGAVSVNGPDVGLFPVIDPTDLTLQTISRLIDAFEALSKRVVRTVFEELGFPLCKELHCSHVNHPYEHIIPSAASLDRVRQASPDRFALDEVVFDVLGLTAGEREAVYEAVVGLVRARLEKAQSV